MISISEVIKRSKINGKDAHSSTANRDSRHDPVNGWERTPTEPEQANRQKHRLHADEIQSAFGRSGVFTEAPGDAFLVDADDCDDDDADTHRSEDGAGLLDCEVVVCAEDEWH